MEKVYFPMKVCNITQGYGSNTYSHQKVMALDIAGIDSGIDVAYAPFSGTVKKLYGTDHQVWLASNDKVLCADGKERFLVMLVAHNNEVKLKVGQVIKQGEEFYKEGTYGGSTKITGNHIHMELGEGPFSGSGWFQNEGGKWQINKPLAPEKILWLKKDTVIKNTIAGGKDYMMKWDNETTMNYPFAVGTIVYPQVDVILKSNAGYGNEGLWTIPKGTYAKVEKYNTTHGLYMALKNEQGAYFSSAWTNEFDKFSTLKPIEDSIPVPKPDENTNQDPKPSPLPEEPDEPKNWLKIIIEKIINFITNLFKILKK